MTVSGNRCSSTRSDLKEMPKPQIPAGGDASLFDVWSSLHFIDTCIIKLLQQTTDLRDLISLELQLIPDDMTEC